MATMRGTHIIINQQMIWTRRAVQYLASQHETPTQVNPQLYAMITKMNAGSMLRTCRAMNMKQSTSHYIYESEQVLCFAFPALTHEL